MVAFLSVSSFRARLEALLKFGKYDDRIKRETPSIPLFRGKKVPGQLWHAIEKTKHNLRLLSHYPEEVIWEPFFRVYHWVWRRFELWRF